MLANDLNESLLFCFRVRVDVYPLLNDFLSADTGIEYLFAYWDSRKRVLPFCLLRLDVIELSSALIKRNLCLPFGIKLLKWVSCCSGDILPVVVWVLSRVWSPSSKHPFSSAHKKLRRVKIKPFVLPNLLEKVKWDFNSTDKVSLSAEPLVESLIFPRSAL